ncbi:MAG: hypothetical protein H6Q16_859 [Bacteroidetes bacterium]|nr:hypothetical protein [Bacteroidota bacterium]
MELEELKQKWDILSKEVEKQKIINKKLMDNVVNQKLKGLISYNWLGFALSIFAIIFVIYSDITIGMPDVTTYFYIGAIAVFCFMLYDIYNYRILLKAKNYNQDLISAEKTIIKYRQNTINGYICSYVFIIPYLGYFFILFNPALLSTKLFWLVILIFLGALAFTFLIVRWDIGKIKNLQKSLSELKEFEKEE